MWISKKELQKLVEKRSRSLFVSNRIDLITKETDTLKKYIQRLEYEKNELHKYSANVISINSKLRAELNELKELKELKEENDKFKKANDSLYKRVYDLSHKRDNLERQIEMLEDDKEKLKELYVATRKVQESLIPKYQKLHSENEVLIKENEELKNKELKDIEKICDGVNSELLDLCTKLSDENMLLIHKQPIIREDKPQPNKPTERFKRDQYGVISKVEKKDDPCTNCVYFNLDSTSEICIHCQNNHSDDEYYSSK